MTKPSCNFFQFERILGLSSYVQYRYLVIPTVFATVLARSKDLQSVVWYPMTFALKAIQSLPGFLRFRLLLSRSLVGYASVATKDISMKRGSSTPGSRLQESTTVILNAFRLQHTFRTDFYCSCQNIPKGGELAISCKEMRFLFSSRVQNNLDF